ncbi:Coiled-coil domain-containing protein 25 [Camellia lanceoleosa]|uniref:Coiled-coil domain-containing protein 25 n=1 Tax=Camellia lanceoleosa TaxID=1840588 RepID=A0ACC0H921_9ERIC|nr:Coiled-coil domain-containing protein 25 [Camellia lanceoleosa]
MVFYFKARAEARDYTIFMGLNKFENEELNKYGFPEDIWFHVDKMSSAHVYVRLHKVIHRKEEMVTVSVDGSVLDRIAKIMSYLHLGSSKKASVVEDSRESPRERQLNKGSSEPHVSRVTPLKREESFWAEERLDGGQNQIRVGLIDKKLNGSKSVSDDHFEKKKENSEVIHPNYPAIGSIPNAIEVEQVAIGWPSRLAAVAGKAINGWVLRRADSFEKLEKRKKKKCIWALELEPL